MGEGSLTGAKLTQRQLHHQSPPQHGRQLTELGACSVLHGLQAAQQVEECLFLVAQVI